MKFVSSAVMAALLIAGASVARADMIYTLTAAGATATDLPEGVKYTQVAAQSTGTGVLPSFVRIQGNTDVVAAYNTTVQNTLDNTADATHNHELLFQDVGITTIGGTDYVGFLLDMNHTGADPLLSLDEVQVFISSSPNQSVETFTGTGLVNFANSALVYRLDGTGSNDRVELDYSLNSGSGSGDMTLLVPYSLFSTAFTSFFAGNGTTDSAAARNGTFIYLYSDFGVPNNNNDGFEEWAHFNGSPAGEPGCVPTPANNFCLPQLIPEPGPLSLLGIGLAAMGLFAGLRRRSSSSGPLGA